MKEMIMIVVETAFDQQFWADWLFLVVFVVSLFIAFRVSFVKSVRREIRRINRGWELYLKITGIASISAASLGAVFSSFLL